MVAEVEEKRLARAAEAPYCPFTATVTSVVVAVPERPLAVGEKLRWHVLYSDTKPPTTVFESQPNGELAYAAIKLLCQMLGYDDAVVANMNPGVFSMQCTRIIGLRIREKLQLMAVNAMRYCAESHKPFDIPPAVWSHPNFQPAIWCDPYDAVVPSDQRQWVKYNQLADYLCIPQPVADMENNPLAQVHFAGEIVRAANL